MPPVKLMLSCVAVLLAAATGLLAPAPALAASPVSAQGRTQHKRHVRKAVSRRSTRGKHPVRDERHVAALKGNLPNVQALGALVIDLNSGKELYSRKPDQERAIASISKLAAALVVMDRGLEMEGVTTMKKVDIEVARGGAPSRLPEGMTLTNRDLLHAALMGSDNRAVSALGRAVGLNASQFAQAMTQKAGTLGLHHTRFREPTGLSPQNVSTPRELILLLRTVMGHPTLGPIVRKPEYDAHPVSRPPIHYVNTHRPAWRSGMQILGGKTGFNDQARYCLVLAARIDGHDYGIALLGTEGKFTRFGDVARVSDWIVSHKPNGPPPSPLVAKNDGKSVEKTEAKTDPTAPGAPGLPSSPSLPFSPSLPAERPLALPGVPYGGPTIGPAPPAPSATAPTGGGSPSPTSGEKPQI